MGVTACEDWLDMPSESKADSKSVFTTISRADMTVAGAYYYLHTQELGYQILEGTDEGVSKESNSKYNVSNYDYTNLTGMLSNTYISMYKAIEYCNVALQNLPDVPVASDADQKHKDGLRGEALAVRAYAAWNLVRFYGDVPYTEEPTANLTTFESGRVSRDTIYDHAVRDLQEAVTLLPWRSESYLTTPERFTKEAAYGILARVALYAASYSLRWDLSTVPYSASTCKIAKRDDAARVNQLYQIAVDACKAVINHGDNQLLDNYDQLFRDIALKQYNKETMLEYGMYGAHSVDCRTGYTNGITGSGTSPVLGKPGSQMMAMPTFYFEYEEGDQRRDVSICNYALILSSSSDKYKMNTYAGMGVGKYRINWKAERGSTDSRRDINWPLLRYADVLLMYAEALNELSGPTAEAVDAVKKVRTRAFRGDANKAAAGIPTSKDAFRDFIIQERKLELSNEGLRKSDLTRWGIQYEYLQAEKAKLVQLAKHEGKYANVAPYWAYKLDKTPGLNDPTIGLDHIDVTEADLDVIGVSDADKNTLHILNQASKGAITVKLWEAGKNVYLAKSQVPAGVEAKEVEYTLLNMWSINSSSQKGELAVETIDGICKENPWITGPTGVYYGLTKLKTELMPFSQNNIIDPNPGLKEQQHPGYN